MPSPSQRSVPILPLFASLATSGCKPQSGLHSLFNFAACQGVLGSLHHARTATSMRAETVCRAAAQQTFERKGPLLGGGSIRKGTCDDLQCGAVFVGKGCLIQDAGRVGQIQRFCWVLQNAGFYGHPLRSRRSGRQRLPSFGGRSSLLEEDGCGWHRHTSASPRNSCPPLLSWAGWVHQ